jgi:hypothetical protein
MRGSAREFCAVVEGYGGRYPGEEAGHDRA